MGYIRTRLRYRGGAVQIDHAGQADDPDITSQPDHPSPPDGPRPPDAIPQPSDPADRDAIHRAYRAQVDRIYAAHERTDTPADDGAGARRPSSGADHVPITDHPGWPDTDSVKIDSDRAKHILAKELAIHHRNTPEPAVIEQFADPR